MSMRPASFGREMLVYSFSSSFRAGRCLCSMTRPRKQRNCRRYTSCVRALSATYAASHVLGNGPLAKGSRLLQGHGWGCLTGQMMQRCSRQGEAAGTDSCRGMATQL